MDCPVLIEALRGALVESRHRGAVAVVDVDGRRVLALGELDRPIYPRSAVKALQALVLVEAGGAERFGLRDEELALACASHGGEPDHVAGVASILARVGLDEGSLMCGTHWPLHQPAALALARSGGGATALHNNCSGKHAGFLCAACAMECEPSTYVDVRHPVQRAVRSVLEQLGGARIPDEHIGVDGCSVPTFAMPLERLALAFARFGTGRGLAPARHAAARRLRAVCAAYPWHIAGTGRFCTEVMTGLRERVFVKTGAEGVLCAALPEQGLGLALKIDDGTTRAAEAAMAALLARFLPRGDDYRPELDRHARPVLRNWHRTAIGSLQPTKALTGG
ncbi:MAG: asparaginase [Rhodoplanes sp.]|jgi:L-asparaginase II